jgi:hypothetical protein
MRQSVAPRTLACGTRPLQVQATNPGPPPGLPVSSFRNFPAELLAPKGVRIRSIGKVVQGFPGVSPRGITVMCALSGSRFWAPLAKGFRCRKCGSTEGYVSRPRNWVERLILPAVGLVPARCGDCYGRSWRRASLPLLPRREPMRFDPEAMVASARAADGEAGKQTSTQPEDHQRIA